MLWLLLRQDANNSLPHAIRYQGLSMSRAAGYVVRLSPWRQRVFDDFPEYDQFAEAVPEFEHSRNVPLVCFVVSEDNLITHVCIGSRGRIAGTSLRRLNMRNFHKMDRAIPVAHIAGRISSRSRKKVSDTLYSGGLLSPKAFEELVVAISQMAPDTAPVLARYQKERLERIASLPDPVRQALAQQKEALL